MASHEMTDATMLETPKPEARERLLAAAASVFAAYGPAGATSRRIAEAASVNEVTLFRLFGTKDELIEEAVHACSMQERPASLPQFPLDPPSELAAWYAAEWQRLRHLAALLRQCFAVQRAHEQIRREATEVVSHSITVLDAYVTRLGYEDPALPRDREAAVRMFVGALLANTVAVEGDETPGHDASELAVTAQRYARTFLRALGWLASDTPRGIGWEWSPPPDEALDS